MSTKIHPEIVAYAVKLTRSGNYTARQIKTEVRRMFNDFSSVEIDTSIGEAARLLMKQHER